MDEQAKTSIVRIYKRQDEKAWPIGCGFLADGRTILTCRHVISEALRPQTDLLGKEVELDFPFPQISALFKARVILAFEKPDLAKLELLSSVPETSAPMPLSMDMDLWLHPYSAYGITLLDPVGFWDNGKIKSSIADRTIQIESESVYKIEQGFSGTAVWDDEIKRAVGMVAKIDIDPQTKATKAAFVISMAEILEECPELKQLASNMIPSKKPEVITGRKEYLLARLGDLKDNIQRDRDLIKEFEDALRYEDDPRRICKYRQEVERLQESAERYLQEFDKLFGQIKTEPASETIDNNPVT